MLPRQYWKEERHAMAMAAPGGVRGERGSNGSGRIVMLKHEGRMSAHSINGNATRCVVVTASKGTTGTMHAEYCKTKKESSSAMV